MGEMWPPVPEVGDHVDDRAAVIDHPAVVDLPPDDESTGQIASDDGLEPLCRDRSHRSAILAAGVVHQTIDAAVVGQHPLDHGDDRVFVANVSNVRGNRATVGFDLTAHTLELGLVAPDDRDMGTEGGQLMGRATPDTAPAAGDDHALVTKQRPAVAP